MEGAHPVFAPDGPPAEDSSEVAAIVEKIERAGMVGPALLMLSALKPLAWIGGQMLWMLQPFVNAPGTNKRSSITVPGLARLLEQEGGVEDLVQRLNSISRGKER
jgi:hypothetical protein